MSNSLREPETGEFRWTPSGNREIAIAKPVMQDIDRDVREVFAQVPRRGAETGGILLGRIEEDRVSIEASEPVRSEHRFGPLYRLSDDDRQKLAVSLAALRHGRADGLSVVGFYRSLARPEFGTAEEDVELLWGHFQGPERLLLVLQPHPLRGTSASFYLWSNARLVQAFPPMPFPFTDAPTVLPHPEPDLPRPLAAGAVPEPPRPVIAEPERPAAVSAAAPPPAAPLRDRCKRSLCRTFLRRAAR
jgi:hypothetical protein